ncbi:MAG: hypothetical protein A2W23_02655 [Planctomycetes bacterium RBG_16_43_13]|nr:MAG: hypothetical protein A2W23_02655 [Planctomycetes bacterium RBG_16_43_13]
MTALVEDTDLEDNDDFLVEGRELIIKKLKENDLLRYGATISEGLISSIMNVEKNNVPFEKWQFTVLQFREVVKKEGFFVTSRGKNNDIYILQPHEMPIHNSKKTKAVFRSLKQRQRSLHMIDTSFLGEEHRKKLEFEILKNASLELEMANLAKSRCRY